ncbi:3-phenylpropionate-dihydrodiol/cinnamic acid-dihydrodiol dehydrogenase [compost metagenome]
MDAKLRVLFVCLANDARSQLAEALLRHIDSEHFEALSGGVEPSTIDPRTLQTLEHAGISTSGLRCKSVDEFADEHLDYVIDLCDKSSDEVQKLPLSKEVIVWSFVDPAKQERPDAFRHAFQELHDRIKLFVMVKERERTQDARPDSHTATGRLAGKVAIITGASAGIGHAAARLFAAEGAKVVVGARREEELNALVAQIRSAGGEAVAIAGDVRSEAYAKALVALAVEQYGRLDIAFNNAGTLGEGGPSTEVSESGWNDTIAINLTGSFLGAKHQIGQMLKHGGGSVIFTSTFVGHTFAFPGVAAYAASKSGLIGLTQALAAEFGPQGVRVNAILPGAVDTDMYRSMNSTAEAQSFITNLHALKRIASPEELARSVLYLASDDSAFVTGTAALVDGGASITRT